MENAMPTDGQHLRDATADDVKALTVLRRDFMQTQLNAGLLDIPLDIDASLAKTTPVIVKGGRSQCVLIDTDGRLDGYIYFALRASPGMTQPLVGVIEELYVAPHAARRGHATRLVDHARDRLTALDAARIQTRVLAGNAAARSFWQRAGFDDNVHLMEFAAKAPAA